MPATATLISNEAEFGHGFTIAGSMLLHILGMYWIVVLCVFVTVFEHLRIASLSLMLVTGDLQVCLPTA